MTDESFALVVEFRAAPGRVDELRETLLAAVEPTRAEAGCLRYDLHVGLDDPQVLAFYEIWESPAHHAAHDGTEHIATLRAALPGLLAEPTRKVRLVRVEPPA
jgi:quinol monooxygenase YgiN